MQNTHNSDDIEQFHNTLLSVIFQFNNPNRDDIMINSAGISLDPALFPLLIAIDRFGPIGVVKLADMVGRDYTTVSRQITKLVKLKLIIRTPDKQDKRINLAMISPEGKVMTTKIDSTRQQFYQQIFSQWSEQEFAQFSTMLTRFTQGLQEAETLIVTQTNPA